MHNSRLHIFIRFFLFQNPSPNFNISNDTQIYEVKLKKKESVEHSQEHEINNKYIIENFPLFLKKLD